MDQMIEFTMVHFTVGSIEVIKVVALPVHASLPPTSRGWWIQTW